MINRTEIGHKKIIIIGAGPAGLTAAYELSRLGCYQVTVLEASSEIGGISKTVKYHGNRIDIGGHRFFSKDDRIVQFWCNLLPIQGKPAWDDLLLQNEKEWAANGPDPEIDDRVMLIRRRVSRILYLRKFFDYPVSIKWDTFRNMGLRRSVIAGFGYLFALLFKRKEISLKDFMINRFGEPLYRMFFEKYTEKLWGQNPADISASWGAQRVKGLSLLKALTSILQKHLPFLKNQPVETSLIEEFIYPKCGPGQLWEAAASEIRHTGSKIVMNSEVIRIEMKDARTVSSVIAKKEGEEVRYPADFVLSSMPIKDLVAAFPSNYLSDDVRQWATELPYRDFITVGLEVPKLAIVNHTKLKTVNQIVPDCWIYVQEPDVKIGRLQIFNNWSPYMVRDPEHCVWIGLEYFCTEGDSLWAMDDEFFIRFAIEELKSIHVIDADTPVLSSTRIKVKKAYPAYFGSYEHFDAIRTELDTVNNLFCIGRNGQHRYNNMDHSMLTAMEAVRLIHSGETNKTHLWNINAEEEYHEAKQS